MNLFNLISYGLPLIFLLTIVLPKNFYIFEFIIKGIDVLLHLVVFYSLEAGGLLMEILLAPFKWYFAPSKTIPTATSTINQ